MGNGIFSGGGVCDQSHNERTLLVRRSFNMGGGGGGV